MARVLYLTPAEAIEIHRQLIERFGGTPGLRDPGRLEAAIFRPQAGYYAHLFDQAAALMESVANNHAFVDGNKRAAFALTDTFLRLNGFYLETDSASAFKFIAQGLETGEFRFERLRLWIAKHARALR